MKHSLPCLEVIFLVEIRVESCLNLLFRSGTSEIKDIVSSFVMYKKNTVNPILLIQENNAYDNNSRVLFIKFYFYYFF